MNKEDTIAILVKEQVVDLVEKANTATEYRAAYLACIAGMWSDVLRYETKPAFKDTSLKEWFRLGKEASSNTRNIKI